MRSGAGVEATVGAEIGVFVRLGCWVRIWVGYGYHCGLQASTAHPARISAHAADRGRPCALIVSCGSTELWLQAGAKPIAPFQKRASGGWSLLEGASSGGHSRLLHRLVWWKGGAWCGVCYGQLRYAWPCGGRNSLARRWPDTKASPSWTFLAHYCAGG